MACGLRHDRHLEATVAHRMHGGAGVIGDAHEREHVDGLAHHVGRIAGKVLGDGAEQFERCGVDRTHRTGAIRHELRHGRVVGNGPVSGGRTLGRGAGFGCGGHWNLLV